MFKYLWLIAINAITVLVLFAMFGHAETPFQTITFSVLAIIYGTVINVGVGLAQQSMHATRFNMGEFARIRTLLNDNELNVMDILEYENMMGKANIQFFIAYVFTSCIWFVAVWNIVGLVL